MKKIILISFVLCQIISCQLCLANTYYSLNLSDDTDSRYTDLITQAEVYFDIHNWWNANGGIAKSIDGKVIISYSGFTKLAIVYYTFKNSPTSIEYKMKVLDEKSGWGQNQQFYYRQYIVQNMDNPLEKCLMVVTNTKAPGSYHLYLYTEPYFFDTLKYYVPDKGIQIISVAE